MVMDIEEVQVGIGISATASPFSTSTSQGHGNGTVTDTASTSSTTILHGYRVEDLSTSTSTTTTANTTTIVMSRLQFKPPWAATGVLHACLDPLAKKIKEETADLEFICEGHVQVKAHRIVFALFSPFFTAIFKDQDTSSPTTVILDRVQAKHMKIICQLAYGQPTNIYIGKKDLKEVCNLLRQFGLSPNSFRLNNGNENIESFWPKPAQQRQPVPSGIIPKLEPEENLSLWLTMDQEEEDDEQDIQPPIVDATENLPDDDMSSSDLKKRKSETDTQEEPLTKRLRSSFANASSRGKKSKAKSVSVPPSKSTENVWAYVCKICTFRSANETQAMQHGKKCCQENNSGLQYKSSYDREAFGFFGNVQCPLQDCGKRFIRLCGLVIHTSKMHPDFKKLFTYNGKNTTLTCNNCEQTYTTPTEFYEHLDATHEQCPEAVSGFRTSLSSETPFRPVTRSSIIPKNLNTSLPYVKTGTEMASRAGSSQTMSLRSSTRAIVIHSTEQPPNKPNVPITTATTAIFRVPSKPQPIANTPTTHRVRSVSTTTTTVTNSHQSATSPILPTINAISQQPTTRTHMVHVHSTAATAAKTPKESTTPSAASSTDTSNRELTTPNPTTAVNSNIQAMSTPRISFTPSITSTPLRDPLPPAKVGTSQAPRINLNAQDVPRPTSKVIPVPASSRTFSNNSNQTQTLSSSAGGTTIQNATRALPGTSSRNVNQTVTFPGESALGNSRINIMELATHLLDPDLLNREFSCRHCNTRKEHYRDSAKCLEKHGIFRCSWCFNTYRTKRLLDEHQREVHKDGDGKLVCPICQMSLGNAGGCASHIYNQHWYPVLRRALPESEWTQSLRGRGSSRGSGRGGGSGRR